jgi:AraC-like DNA-binding protein
MKPVLFNDDVATDDTAADAQRWQRMRNVIIDRQLYLQPGITLNQIAREVNVCRTTLSNTINRQENKNFNTFINNLRIEDAQQLMRQNPDKSLLDISLAVGYTEQSNFTVHFKQYAGITPAEWRKLKN